MKISHSTIPALRTTVVLGFVALCVAIFTFLWTNAGGRIPLVSQEGYRVTVSIPDADNLVFQSDVRIAGVGVGKIEALTIDGQQAMATLELDDDVAPLHEGVTVTVRNKTLIEETYLDVVDGDGPKILSGSTLPEGTSQASVQLNDVLTSLDQPTRDQLGSMLRSTGAATEGTRDEVDDLLTGLGHLGREGSDALAALSDQSKDLAQLVQNTSTVIEALDTQHGQIAQLASDADAITASTAKQKEDIARLMRTLPSFLDTTRDATGDLERLSEPLGVVARNLDDSAPDLSAALELLPGTTEDLRGLVPQLDQVLDRAPATLKKTPALVTEAQPVVGSTTTVLADVNPMLAYLKPYGKDFISQFVNVGLSLGASDPDGHILRVRTIFDANSVNLPLPLTAPGLVYNPYPEPGNAFDPQPFSGQYPRIAQDSIPK